MKNNKQGKITDKTIVAIPDVFKKREFRFVLVKKNEKTPLESNWQTKNNYPFNGLILKNHLKNGGNYGILSGRGQLACFDADNIERLTELGIIQLFDDSGTVKVESSKGFHYYFLSDGEAHGKYELNDPDIADSNSGQLGDIRFDGNFMTVGPNSHHPSGAVYRLVDGGDFKEIPTVDILKLIAPLVIKKSPGSITTVPITKTERKKSGSTISDYLDLRVDQFLMPDNPESLPNGDIIGVHPVHGSSSAPANKNLRIHTSTNTWKCFSSGCGGTTDKPGSSGSGLEAYAVAKGLMKCSECQPGWSKTNPELFKEILDRLRDDGYGEKINEWYDLHRQEQSVTVDKSPEEIAAINEHKKYLLEHPRFTLHLEEGNWVRDFYEHHVHENAAPYPEYFHAAAMALLSIATKRRVSIFVNKGRLRTNLWLMCLGPSTISHKSDVVNDVARSWARAIYPEDELGEAWSGAGLFENLEAHPISYMVNTECAEILNNVNNNKEAGTARDLLCKVYDCEDRILKRLSSRVNGRKSEFVIENVFVTFFWATTPESFSKHSSSFDVDSGWLIRFLYYNPNYNKDPVPMNFDLDQDTESTRKLGETYKKIRSLIDSKDAIIAILPFDGSQRIFQEWHLRREREVQQTNKKTDEKLFNRLEMIALKLAILYEIASPSWYNQAEVTGVVVSEKHMEEAIREIDEYFLPHIKSVIENVEKDTTKNMQEKILMVLKERGGIMLRRELSKGLHIQKLEFSRHLDALAENEEIEEYRDGAVHMVRLLI